MVSMAAFIIGIQLTICCTYGQFLLSSVNVHNVCIQFCHVELASIPPDARILKHSSIIH